MVMNDISNIRLINQQVSSPAFKNVKEVVSWMGAMQSQDFPMSEWAVGVRLKHPAASLVEAAFNSGEILRTHLLRPTLHLVSAENIRWMLKLSAPAIKTRLKPRLKELEITGPMIKKCNKIIADALKEGNHQTREELYSILTEKKINPGNQRGYHVLVNAELDGLICSGIIKGGKQTYALLDERVPGSGELTREEALKKLAGLYFSSRGPASLQDFKWWSGMNALDARNALELARSSLVSEKSGTGTYWFSDNLPFQGNDENNAIRLLPAFDEFILSYKDRLASVPLKYQKRTISDNGIFWPIIVIDAQVSGLWKRTIRKEKVIIEIELFNRVSRSIKDGIERKCELFALFLDKKAEIRLTIRGR